MIKDKIAKIIYDELYYMYCDNCRYTEIDEDDPNCGCDDCHRKYNGWGISMAEANRLAEMAIEALSTDRPTVDCTKFMEWLKAEVLDEENWELNAIANGEVICRKFKKLGWLDVEDGFYVDTRPTGEWKQVDLLADRLCSVCGYGVWDSEAEEYNYCPNCGAKMVREDGEEE